MVADLNISALLDSSQKISKTDKAQLSLLKDEFPWSELIQVLYLKSLKDSNDIRFSDELKRVALISHDRAKLYYFLYGSEIQETINKVEAEMAALPEAEGLISPDWDENLEPAASVENKETTSAEIPEMKLTPEIGLTPISELMESAKTQESELTEPALGAEKDTPASNPEKPTVPDHLEPKHSEHDMAEVKEQEQPVLDESPLDELPVNEEATELKNEVSEDKGKLNHLIISEAVDAVIVKDVMDDMEDKRAKTTASEVKPIAPAPTETVSSDEFIAWLVNNAKAVNYPSFDQSSGTKSAATIESIIDTFIKSEPQIQKGKAKEYEKGNLASDSLVDKEEFVTETLAEIYVSQGNNSKAKRAFQLLSLKYPEKSIYFAARIKQLGAKKQKK